MSPVLGAAESSATVAVGRVFVPTVAVAVAAGEVAVPSVAVTSTVTVSPSSPLPACARSSVSVVELVPAVVCTVEPFTFQT